MTMPKKISSDDTRSASQPAVQQTDTNEAMAAGFAHDAKKEHGKIIINRVSDLDRTKLLEDFDYVKQFSNMQRPNIAKIITACSSWIDQVESLESYQQIKPQGYYDKEELVELRETIEGELQKSVLGRYVYEKIAYEEIDVTGGFRFVEVYITLTYIEEMELQKKNGNPDIIESMGIKNWKGIQNIADYIQEYNESYSLQRDLKRQGGPILQLIKTNNPNLYTMIVSLQTLLEKFFEMHRVDSSGGRKMKKQQTKGMLKHMKSVKAQVKGLMAKQSAANASTNIANMNAEQKSSNTLKK